MLDLRSPKVMGIINITPDSFYDGGLFFSIDEALHLAEKMLKQGAAILDVGGVSTRPKAEPVSTEEEMRRALPVIETLHLHFPDAILCIDTHRHEVAEQAVGLGASIVNDVSAGTMDESMFETVLKLKVPYIIMHMQGTPQTMQDNPTYLNVVADVRDYLQQRRESLELSGIPLERICLDPGIGFGKTQDHNITLMRNCYQFHPLDCPLLVGYSRKGFLGKLIGDKDADRVNANVGAALGLAVQGVQIVRVHDVRAVREALTVFEATGGLT